MTHYYLESNQADRVKFDEMVYRGIEAAFDAVDSESKQYYLSEAGQDVFIGVQWDADQVAFTDDVEYAEDMGLIYVEDMIEAEARYTAVGRQFLTEYN